MNEKKKKLLKLWWMRKADTDKSEKIDSQNS